MFKQSFYIIAIQIVGIVLGALSIYLVAGDMGPEVYSLVGIFTVVSGFVQVFSHLGVETTMMREALYWMEHGNIEKVKEYTVQSVVSRLIGFIILSPIVIGYLLFVCYTKYDGGHFVLLMLYFVGACVTSLNDSLSLIVRSQGGYVFAALVRAANADIIKSLAIILYILYGAQIYLYFYCLSTIPLLFVFYLKLRKFFSWKYVSMHNTLTKIKDAKNLWLKSYMDYFSTYADSLLVSVLFPSSIMGLYTLYKNLESMARSFIEGFFDVIIQKFVQYKGDFEKLCQMEKKVNLVRWIVIGSVLIFGLLFSLNPDFFVGIANLAKYENVEVIIYAVMIVAVLYLAGKIETNLFILMGPSKMILRFGFIMFFTTLLSFIVVLVIQNLYGVLAQRMILYLTMSIVGISIFKRNRNSFFTNIYK